MLKTSRLVLRRRAFTLIELLTVIAIIGILAAIIIPTVGKVRETAKRSADSSNLREIAKAALTYANDNRERLPGPRIDDTPANIGLPASGAQNVTPDLYAAACARGGGLNESKIWVSGADQNGTNTEAGGAVLAAKTAAGVYQGLDATYFVPLSLAFGVVGGLNTSDPATTPIAFTRGLTVAGTWDGNKGVYKSEGGHIVYMGGNVAFYRNLGAADATGELIGSGGGRTIDITKTIKATRSGTVKFIMETTAGTATEEIGSGASGT